MKYLHITTNEKFINSYIGLICKGFNSKEHTFIILNKGKWLDKKDVKGGIEAIFMQKRMRDILKFIIRVYRSDRIILHSIFNRSIVIFLFCQPWLLKKCNWVMWGGDLYYFKFRKHTLKKNIYEFIRSFIIRRFGYISYLTQGDYDLVKEWYQTHAKPIQASYGSGLVIETCSKLTNEKIKPLNSQINIIIGNSADKTNNHIQMLDLLYQYKDKGIQIFCPLSYGDMKYANTIIEYGKEKYEGQFHPLTEYMGFDSYCAFLNEMDIGIFYQDRQQALGNIKILLYLKKKVYLKDTISTWDYLKNDIKVNVYSAEKINIEKYDEFIYFDETTGEDNRKLLEPFLSYDYAVEIWRKNFNIMSI